MKTPKVILTDLLSVEPDPRTDDGWIITSRDEIGRIHRMFFALQHNRPTLAHAQQEIDRLVLIGGDPLLHVIPS